MRTAIFAAAMIICLTAIEISIALAPEQMARTAENGADHSLTNITIIALIIFIGWDVIEGMGRSQKK